MLPLDQGCLVLDRIPSEPSARTLSFIFRYEALEQGLSPGLKTIASFFVSTTSTIKESLYRSFEMLRLMMFYVEIAKRTYPRSLTSLRPEKNGVVADDLLLEMERLGDTGFVRQNWVVTGHY
jgi:hypothetical protein